MIPWVPRKPTRNAALAADRLAFEGWDLPEQPVDLDDWQHEMSMWQGGLCAACGCSFPSGQDRLDHDHDTGKVRGFLCQRCNQAEGLAGADHPMWSRWRAGANPAAALGIDAPYLHPLTGQPVIRRRATDAELRQGLAGLADVLDLEGALARIAGPRSQSPPRKEREVLLKRVALVVAGALALGVVVAVPAEAGRSRVVLVEDARSTELCKYAGGLRTFEITARFRYKHQDRWLLTNGMQVGVEIMEFEAWGKRPRWEYTCYRVKDAKVPASWYGEH